jgi:hypothetical protein
MTTALKLYFTVIEGDRSTPDAKSTLEWMQRRWRARTIAGLAFSCVHVLSGHAALDLLFGHPADEHRHLAAAYRALTAEHVREVASRIVSVSPTVVTVLP